MSIHAIPGHFPLLRIKTNQKPARFSSVRVGAYCIRPTNGHGRGRMNLIPIRFLILRIKTNQNPDKFSSDRVGAYCIRLTDDHAGGRTERKIAIFLGTRVGAQQHTPHRQPRQRPNESNSDPIFDSPDKNEPKPCPVFICPCRGVLNMPHRRPHRWSNG